MPDTAATASTLAGRLGHVGDNEALREHIERQSGTDLESTLRRVLREELTAANP